MTRGSRILRRAFKVAGVCLLSAIAVALLFEAYLRRTGFLEAQPANYPCVAGDPVLNHVFQKHCEGLAAANALKTERDVTYRTNDFGFRGHAPESGKHTLVVLGDSYTEGFGLEETEAFPAVLESALRSAGHADWQVLNGGTLGFSAALYPLYFDRYFLLQRPEAVLLNLDLTDFNDDPYYLQIADYDPTGRPIAFPGRESFPQWALPYVYSNRSALVRFLHQEVNQWSLVKRREAVQWQMDMWIHAERTLIRPEDLHSAQLDGCAKAAEAVAKHVLLLRDHAVAVGARFGMHMYPPGTAVKSYASLPQSVSFVRLWDQKHRTDYSWACGVSPKIVDVMRAFAEREHIAFFDSFPTVLAQENKAELYYDRDAHWNSRGVKLVAASLAPRLRDLLGAHPAGIEPTGAAPKRKKRK